jgi:predicted flap endonuclease-1-like 5' DNA nuclease
MNAVAVFAGAFLILAVITLAIPGLPPGEMVLEVAGFPQATGSFLGISVSTLLNCLVNGFLWGLFAAAVYGLSRRGRKPLLPLPEPEELPSPPLKAMPVDERVEKIPPAMTVREGRFRHVQDRDVKTIEGIGSLRSRLLNDMGVRTVDDLLRVGGTSVGRQRIARRLGVSYKIVLGWVHRGDLLRVRGVGRQYSELLESAGVSSVADLSNRNAHVLWQTLRGVNREKRLVRRVPPHGTIEMWVYDAKKLDPMIR